MNCGEVRERIGEYLDGLLGEEESGEVELHCASCEQCGMILEEYRRMLAATGELSPQAPDLVSRVSPQLQREARKKRTSRAVRWAVSAAAVLLVGIFAATGLFRGENGYKMLNAAAPAALSDTESAAASSAAACSLESSSDALNLEEGMVTGSGASPASVPEPTGMPSIEDQGVSGRTVTTQESIITAKGTLELCDELSVALKPHGVVDTADGDGEVRVPLKDNREWLGAWLAEHGIEADLSSADWFVLTIYD